MSMESGPKCCPKCGGAIPAEAPEGLCPKCLLMQASNPTEAGSESQPRPAPPTREELAAAFPQLEILELIGRGGMGFVFKARQPKLDRLVALKILSQSLAADAAFAGRFTREGRVLARLSHPNIVAIHDFGQANGFCYLLMEYVDGVNLRQAMKAGRFTPAQALDVVPKICAALQFAHAEGILHRDIKPENILLDTKGRVKIADFGIAKLVGEPRAEATLTGSGATLGTPLYMAPEQLEHPQEVDQRADVYSLGVVFYEMLTGELPLGRFVPPSEKSTVDPRMDEVVMRTLEKERERRTPSAGELKTQVETVAATPRRAAAPAQTTLENCFGLLGPSGRLAVFRDWPPLAVFAVGMVGLSLLSFGFLPVLSHRWQVSLRPLIVLAMLLQFTGSTLGALALWDFPNGAPRRGLAGALFAVFFPTLMGSCSFLYLPLLGFRDAPRTLFASFVITWAIPALLLWLIVRAWRQAASAYTLAGELNPAPGHQAETARNPLPVSSGWKASAWVFLAVAGFEFLGCVSQMHAVLRMPSGRAAADLFAGIALLTLNPRWRTAAIVTLWTGCFSWILSLALDASHLDYARLRFFGSTISFDEQPFVFLLVALADLATFVWPYWMLTSEKGKALFGLDAKP